MKPDIFKSIVIVLLLIIAFLIYKIYDKTERTYNLSIGTAHKVEAIKQYIELEFVKNK